MNSMPHDIQIHPQGLSAADIVDQLAKHRGASGAGDQQGDEYGAGLQEQYEGRVLALVVRDLATAAPAASETVVMELVAQVWEQVEGHFEKASTTWAHVSWFVQNTIARFVAGLRPQMAGC